MGEVLEIKIYKIDESGMIVLQEIWLIFMVGIGDSWWYKLFEILFDCSMLLINGVGNIFVKILTESGIKVSIIEGLVHEVLNRYFIGELMEKMVCRWKECGAECFGDGGGCGSWKILIYRWFMIFHKVYKECFFRFFSFVILWVNNIFKEKRIMEKSGRYIFVCGSFRVSGES